MGGWTIIFRWRFLGRWLGMSLLKDKFGFWYPVFRRASSYSGLVLLKTFSLDELFLSRLLIEIGNCFKIFAGWFAEVWTYCRRLFGFLYGLMMSISKPISLKVFITYFLALSAVLLFEFWRSISISISIPTNSHTSAPSKLLIITSKQSCVSFFFQGSPSKNRRDLQQCKMVLISLSVISVWAFANVIEFTKISLVIDG